MPASRRPTLRDVAATAGVSHMTVSRVVAGSHVVSETTVAKVRAAILKLGYRPDPALSALAAYRSKQGGARGSMIAFLDCDGTPYTEIVLEGARREARLLGYGTESFRLSPDRKSQERLSKILFHRGMLGLLVGPSDDLWRFEGWRWEEFATVSLGALVHQPAMHAVAMDYFQAAQRGTEMLLEQGCRRIALAVDPRLESRTGHRWLGGYFAALGVTRKKWTFGQVHAEPAQIKEWARREKIDGVLTIHLHVWQALAAECCRFVFLNDTTRVDGVPYLSLDARDIGAEGVRVLHHLLLRREFGIPAQPKVVALQGSWAAG